MRSITCHCPQQLNLHETSLYSFSQVQKLISLIPGTEDLTKKQLNVRDKVCLIVMFLR